MTKPLQITDTFLDASQLRDHIHPQGAEPQDLYGYQFCLLKDKAGCLEKCEGGCEYCPYVIELTRWEWQSNGWRHPERMYWGTELLSHGIVDVDVFDWYIKPLLNNYALNHADFH